MSAPTPAEVAEAIGGIEQWSQRCHEASLAVLRSGVVRGRVARGWCKGVGGQHSWVVAGNGCYADDAVIVDPTLWSYDTSVSGVWVGSARAGRHVPHGGSGNIWNWGRPRPPSGPIIELPGGLSREATLFLRMVGPLDLEGWGVLFGAPVAGWPASEIVAAALLVPQLAVRVPIDIAGMLTDANPNGLYLAESALAREEGEGS